LPIGLSLRDIRFTRPYVTGRELTYIQQAIESGCLFGEGPFNRRCAEWLQAHTGASTALTTPSGTHSLELAALTLGLEPGDEVVMPSFTFVSTANAIALRGAVPVFVDIRPDTLNIDERQIEQAISDRTRAIIPVHYAGIGCEMDAIMRIARDHEVTVIEDAAHAIGCSYRGRMLGAIGDFGCLSFDGQKNVTSGEGGALLVKDRALADRAVNIQAKGTNRAEFLRGEVNRYEWVSLGSSFLPSEITAALLAAQLESAEEINERRRQNWDHYHRQLSGLQSAGHLTLPTVPDGCKHNGHLFYVLLDEAKRRPECLDALKRAGVEASWHYVPLHSSPAGRRLGRIAGSMTMTESSAARLLRLPVHTGISEEDIAYVAEVLHDALLE
jgi:dTDP-4-amino-4,6-dideoxygalactose transaminase